MKDVWVHVIDNPKSLRLGVQNLWVSISWINHKILQNFSFRVFLKQIGAAGLSFFFFSSKLHVSLLRFFSFCSIYRKLLEGEETRFSTSGSSILGLNPFPNPGYLLPPRILSSTTSKVSSTGLSLKKEEEGEEEEASKVTSKKTSQIEESFEEILEETVMSTKKTEKSNIEESTTISSQKI